MTTPTGYTFYDTSSSTVKDFADVFNIINNGVVTTGYKSTAYGNKDLGYIFHDNKVGTTHVINDITYGFYNTILYIPELHNLIF